MPTSKPSLKRKVLQRKFRTAERAWKAALLLGRPALEVDRLEKRYKQARAKLDMR